MSFYVCYSYLGAFDEVPSEALGLDGMKAAVTFSKLEPYCVEDRQILFKDVFRGDDYESVMKWLEHRTSNFSYEDTIHWQIVLHYIKHGSPRAISHFMPSGRIWGMCVYKVSESGEILTPALCTKNDELRPWV